MVENTSKFKWEVKPQILNRVEVHMDVNMHHQQHVNNTTETHQPCIPSQPKEEDGCNLEIMQVLGILNSSLLPYAKLENYLLSA